MSRNFQMIGGEMDREQRQRDIAEDERAKPELPVTSAQFLEVARAVGDPAEILAKGVAEFDAMMMRRAEAEGHRKGFKAGLLFAAEIAATYREGQVAAEEIRILAEKQ